MILVTLSTDTNILKQDSAVRARMISYGPLFDCFHIVLVSKGKSEAEKLSETVSVTTTGGFTRFTSLVRAGIILCQTISRLKKKNQKIVLSSQDPFENGLVCFVASKITGTPLHLQVHTDVFSPYFAVESFVQALRVRIAHFLLPKADGVRVVSERIRDSFDREGIVLKNPAVVLPIFVDTEKIQNHVPNINLHTKYPQFEKIILMLSRLTHEKDIPTALKAFEIVLQKYPNTGLVIVGTGKEESVLKQFVTEHCLAKNVVFEGWTNDPISYMKTCDVFLNTSLYEGYGLTLIEALYSGVPVVTSDVGVAYDSQFENQFLVFPIGSAEKCVEKISEVFQEKKQTVLPVLMNHDEYLKDYTKSFEISSVRLLILTQIVDKNDTLLGFVHGWISEFSKIFPHIVTICLKKGEMNLPKNVSVFSLGKESGRGRIRYVFRFYFLIWKYRNQYDAVFVHMNQEYVLLGAILWKILGKKVYMWRNHSAGNVFTSIACFLCDKTFCPSKFSYINRFKKNVLMPVGVDTGFFRPVPGIVRKTHSILSLGRIAPVKNIHLLIDAVSKIKNIPWTLTIVGDPLPVDVIYHERLKQTVAEHGLSSQITFVAGIPNIQTRDIYSSNEIFVNMSPSGLFDKTMFEAVGCGALLVTTNPNFVGHIDPRCIATEITPTSLEKTIRGMLVLNKSEKEMVQDGLRQYLESTHGLSTLCEGLFREMTRI